MDDPFRKVSSWAITLYVKVCLSVNWGGVRFNLVIILVITKVFVAILR